MSTSLHKLSFWLIATVLASFHLGTAQATNIGESTANLTTKQGQIIAERWQRRINSSQSQTDLSVQYYLQQLAEELNQAGNLGLSDLSVALIQNNSFNAFAGLGQFMGIHQGLILHLEDEDALASIVAHELGHMQAKHIERIIDRQQQLGAANLASIISGLIIASTVDTQAGMAVILGGQALTLNQLLSFSRANETEADQIARQVLTAADRDEQGFSRAMQQIARQQQLMGSQPPWLGSHPLAETRLTASLSTASIPANQSISLDFWAAKARIRPDVAQEKAPASIQQLQQLLATPEQTAEKWPGLWSELEQGSSQLARVTLVELICAQHLPECHDMAQTQLLIDPNHPSLRLALVDDHLKQRQWQSAWRVLQLSPERLQRQPDYWQRRSVLLNELHQPIAAISAQAEMIWWQGQEALAIEYLQNQSRRLADPSLQRLLNQKQQQLSGL